MASPCETSADRLSQRGSGIFSGSGIPRDIVKSISALPAQVSFIAEAMRLDAYCKARGAPPMM